MKTFEKILEHPVIATIMAAKILGRIIDQTARGFGDDENIPHELNLYKAIAAKYPKDTVGLRKMHTSMWSRAKAEESRNDVLEEKFSNMSDEERAIWSEGNNGPATGSQALEDCIPQLTKLFGDATPDAESWNELPVIAQWSLLNYTEADIPNKVAMYKSWADRDREAKKTSTNAMRLQAEAEASSAPMFKIVSEFLENKTVKEALAIETDAGTNVPARFVQTA